MKTSVQLSLVLLSAVFLVPQFEQFPVQALQLFDSSTVAPNTSTSTHSNVASPDDSRNEIANNEIVTVPDTGNNGNNSGQSKKEIVPIKTNNNKKDDRIDMPETVKTMLMSSVRLAVELSPLPKFVSTDTIMHYVGRVSQKLARIATLVAAVKAIAFVVTGVSLGLFLLPAGSLAATAAFLRSQQKRAQELEHFWRHTMHPDAIVDQLARTSDDAMDRLGFQDRTCRERSICEIGDILACSFPSFVAQAKDFATNSLPEIDVARNKYSRALVAGLNRTDCAGRYEITSAQCSSLLEWFNATFWGNVPPNKITRM